MKPPRRRFRTPFFVFLGLLVIAALAFLSGPVIGWRPEPRTAEVARVEQSGDLDRYLADSEAQVTGLKPGLGRSITWADPATKAKTPLSIVYVHGFSASRREMYPVWDEVAKALRGNLYYARVKGHGLADGEAFGELTAQDFLDEGRVALAVGRRIGERVVLVGMSTGAAVVLHLAHENRDKDDLAALVLASPNHMPANGATRFLSGPLGGAWARLLLGSHRSFPTRNDAHAQHWTPRYRTEGIVAMMDLINSAAGIDLQRISVPTLTLYTRHDRIVDVARIESRHAEIGAARKRIVDLPGATGHDLAGQALAPECVRPAGEAVIDFLRSG